MATIDDPGATIKALAAEETRVPRRWLQFRLRLSERKLLLTAGDLFLLNGALLVAVLWRTNILSDWHEGVFYYKWFVTLSLLWWIVATVFDVYDLHRAATLYSSVLATVSAAAFTGIVYFLIPWLTPTLENRALVFLYIGMATMGVGLWRASYALLLAQPTFERKALVVGAGASGRALVRALENNPEQAGSERFRGSGLVLVGFIDDDPGRSGMQIHGVPVLGDSRHLVRFARALEVDKVIVAITHTNEIRPELFEALLDCREMGIPLMSMNNVYERYVGRVPIEHAGQDVEIATHLGEGPFVRLYGVIKRATDVLGSLFALFPLAVLIPLVALINRLTSPGPLFYRQQRVGLGGKPFRVIKFRSMRPDAEKAGAMWAQRDDDRVTRLGRLMRSTHLDEVPQFLNVLKGEMSIVGPRPERPEFVGQLSQSIPFYRARHAMRPGITGWAQIHADYGDSIEGAREKLEYDLYYIKHAGPFLDIVIILRTISKVLRLSGR